MRSVMIAAITVVILVIGGFLIAANFSIVTLEYLCEGETRLSEGPPQRDEGRLRVGDYRWWVGLWSDSNGEAVFQSKKIGHFYASPLNKSGQDNFSVYMGLNLRRSFVFRRSTGELGIQHTLQDNTVAYTFVGACQETR